MKKGKIIKITLFSILSFFVLTIIIFSIILHGRISSMMSIKHKGNDLYTMNYKQEYHLDKALKAGIKNGDDLSKFISKDIYFGFGVKNNVNKYACAAFSTETTDGKKLVGRNFDLGMTDTLSLYTHPKDGYKSISTVSTDMLAVGVFSKTPVKSLKGRISLLAAPYVCVDGVNEKGLSASLLDMSFKETHMETGKPDLIVSLAIRLLLDRAATVDEGIELLKKYDIQTAHGWTQHIFISDASGKSAIVEWYNDEMKVIDYSICTNFWMSDPALDGNYTAQCDRFDKLDSSLNEKDKNSVEESMKLLSDVQQANTEWSVVFNLTDFSVDYAVSRDYSTIYHLTTKDY